MTGLINFLWDSSSSRQCCLIVMFWCMGCWRTAMIWLSFSLFPTRFFFISES